VENPTLFIAYILAAMGLTILVVWPEHGPGAIVREKFLRRVLPKTAGNVLDCYICLGFWTGLFMSIPWWLMYHLGWIWFGCLIVPTVFWLVMKKWK